MLLYAGSERARFECSSRSARSYESRRFVDCPFWAPMSVYSHREDDLDS